MHDDHDHAHGSADSGSTNPWPDRVNEAYFDAMGADFGQRTRDRINWMCAQATGGTALDVGCSQGIASILMAREGMRVLGVDIFQPAVDYALAERAKEIGSVRERLQFRCSELAAIAGESFDTVLMGEVIEHQTNAVKFIRHAATLVAPGGRLVITVPFGLHPWPDHKSTVFPGDIVDALNEGFVVRQLDVVDGYIRAIAERTTGSEGSGATALKATEKGAFESQAGFYATRRHEQELATQLAGLEGQRQKLEAETAKRAQSLAVAEALLAELRLGIETHRKRESDLVQVSMELAQHKVRVADLQQRCEADHRRTAQLEAGLEEVRRNERQLQAKVTSQLKDLERQQQLVRQVEELQRNEQQLHARIGTMQQDLAVAQDKRSGHYAHLLAERERAGRLMSLATRLHEDNARYQHSIALAVGRAVLDLRTPRGIVGFRAPSGARCAVTASGKAGKRSSIHSRCRRSRRSIACRAFRPPARTMPRQGSPATRRSRCRLRAGPRTPRPAVFAS